MIQLDSAVDQLVETGKSPYLEPVDVQSNPQNYGDPYDDMICLLREMVVSLARLANQAEQQRARPKLGMYQLISTGSASGLTQVFNTTVRYRVQELVITATGASTVSLIVGTSAQMTFVFATADTKRYSYPVFFDRGVDISLSATGGVGVSGYFTAYADE